MQAMTWWDHETESVWSQPWGAAIEGPLEGTRLEMIPASIIPWGTWIKDHPETLLLDESGRGRFRLREESSDNYVIGISIGDHARGYPFPLASRAGAINDTLGPFPILVLANIKTKSVQVYIRTVGDQDLEFILEEDILSDRQTGSTWDPIRGIAVDGPLRGQVLQKAPYMTSFNWAWYDFFPHTDFWGRDG
jgi:hypothetical protein